MAQTQPFTLQRFSVRKTPVFRTPASGENRGKLDVPFPRPSFAPRWTWPSVMPRILESIRVIVNVFVKFCAVIAGASTFSYPVGSIPSTGSAFV